MEVQLKAVSTVKAQLKANEKILIALIVEVEPPYYYPGDMCNWLKIEPIN